MIKTAWRCTMIRHFLLYFNVFFNFLQLHAISIFWLVTSPTIAFLCKNLLWEKYNTHKSSKCVHMISLNDNVSFYLTYFVYPISAFSSDFWEFLRSVCLQFLFWLYFILIAAQIVIKRYLYFLSQFCRVAF